MKRFIAVLVILIISAGAIWRFTRGEGEATTSYRFVEVTRGDLEAVVSSTGSLEPVRTVAVGTQVSGIVDRLYVDFNDQVRRGQLLARIDTTLLVSAIQDAETQLERNQAQLDFSTTELNRIQDLFDKAFTTEVELNQALYNKRTAVAAVRGSEIGLERARRNLSYARIYAPINGVVIERNVDEGQTVAASLNAPQLYLLASDLTELQILAAVDESDIGQIQEGQTVRFTVQAYDERTFHGTVRQVRLQSAMQDNVITYTAVVDVDNSDSALLPGMTATVEFLVDTVEDAFRVPNAALRFRPTPEMLEEVMERFTAMREQRQSERAASGDSTRQDPTSGVAGTGRPAGSGGWESAAGGAGQGGRSDVATLWYIDENGELAMARARTGLSDGSQTEIMGRNLEEGMQIIAGITTGGDAGSSNPFQQSSGGSRRPGGF